MKRPFLNLLSLLSGDLGSRMIGFVVSVYLARVLEPVGFGLMSLGMAVLGYLQLAASPGIQVLETRNAAALAGVEHGRVNAVLSLRLILAAALWVLTTCFVLLFVPHPATDQVIILFGLSLFPFALTLDWVFQGREDFVSVGLSRLAQFVVYGVVVILLVHRSDDLNLAAIAFVAGAFAAAAVLGGIYVRRWATISPVWSPAQWKDIMARGVPVGGAVFLAQSVTNLPPLAIGYFSSPLDVGLFSSAMKLIYVLLMIDRLFNTLFLPAVTRYFSRKPEEVSMVIRSTLRIILAATIPLTVLGIILGGTAMTLLFGAGYEQGSSVLQILMCYFGLTVVNSIFVCVLLGAGREREYTRALSSGSIVVCIAVVAGAAWSGGQGAAYGVVLGEMVTTGLMMRESAKLISVSLKGVIVRSLLAGGCMVGSVPLLSEAGQLPAIALSLVVFALAQFLLKGVTTKEIQFLRERFV